MSQPSFERFIGIDWSGAEGEHQSGIQVAQSFRGTNAIQLVPPPAGTKWSRQNTLEYLVSLKDARTLIGMDFAFSVPWSEESKPLPVCLERLSTVRELWAFVDDFCKENQYFHAGSIWLSEESPFRPFIKYFRSHDCQYEGALFNGGRLRRTEEVAKAVGLQPKSVYKMAGPQVGAGSFAGMRFLHALGHVSNSEIAVWPFDNIKSARFVFVEIYPAVFYRMAQCKRPTKIQIRDGTYLKIVSEVLRVFEVHCETSELASIDAIDAFVTAAALTSLSRQIDAFMIPPVYASEATKEGWIFGVSAHAQ